MKQLHGSPFSSDFTDYVGKFALLSAQKIHVNIDQSLLPSFKRLSFNDYICNFDFHFFLSLCNSIYGQVDKSKGGNKTSCSLMCDTIKDGLVVNEQNATLQFLHLGNLHYCVDIYFTEPHIRHNGNPLVTCVRMLREGSAITAYVTNVNVQYQFTYCSVLQPDFSQGAVFQLSRTIRIIKQPEMPLQVIGDTTCNIAYNALKRNIDRFFINPINSVEIREFKEEDSLVSDLVSLTVSKLRILDSVPVSNYLEGLLKECYSEFNTIRNTCIEETNISPNLLLSEFPRLVHILTKIIKHYKQL